MSLIVSATASSRRGGSKRAVFISRASVLLRDATYAYGDRDYDTALELGYQAALRTAGAYIADSPIARRKRPPSGAWAQLKLVDDAGRYWAEQFQHYSALRSRVMNGLPARLTAEEVKNLLDMVGQFLDVVEGGYPPLATAA